MQKVTQKKGMQKRATQEKQPLPYRASPCGAGSYAKHGRFWAVTDPAGQMICLAVYKKGAQEVLRRLTVAKSATAGPKRRTHPRRTPR